MYARLVTWLVLLHVAAILLFSRGFLLARLALSDLSRPDTAYTGPGSPKQTHRRAVVLIIDALRFDFVSPDPPEPLNTYHHGVLTLPAELTQARPEHSFIFNAYADPPTTTLQRIKALTTGSLPTFVDAGSNFGGSEILEDSIIKQLQLADRSVAFMGDDTWLSVFPTSFHPNLTFPYDSFNVEDLHTVDTGVLTHLFPLLNNAHPGLPLSSNTSTSKKQFDFLIGHFLGVDHVGHRVGPSHPSMHAKLTQMDTALRRVVDLLDDDTLLVVLGDHGMNKAGDHGGDGVLETSSALWIYSKGPPLTDKTRGNIHPGLLGYKTFPGAKRSWRSIQQIDLLPTLSMLLGLPVPFNNLGTIIPELFWRSSTKSSKSKLELEYALDLNSRQIHQYLETYRASSSGSELDPAWNTLQSAWDAITISPQLSPQNPLEAKLISMASYNRAALSVCRAIWAQFNPELMASGLALMLTAIVTAFLIYVALRQKSPRDGHSFVHSLVPSVWKTTAGVGVTTFTLCHTLRSLLPSSIIQAVPFNSLEAALFTGLMMGCVFAVITSLIHLEQGWWSRMAGQGGIFGAGILSLHAASFFSNSFTFWEDGVVLWLSATAMVPFVLTGIAAPGLSSITSSSSKSKSKRSSALLGRLGLSTLRGRILGFSLLFLVCVRLMSLVTVCREEQGAYCHVTFYATPSIPLSSPSTPLNTSIPSDTITGPSPMAIIPTSTTPPLWSILLSLPTAIIVPVIMTRILKITKSDSGIGLAMVWGVIAPALVGSWQVWVLEWIDSGGLQTTSTSPSFFQILETFVGIIEPLIRLRTLRSWIARGVCALLGLGIIGWSIIPLCLDIHVRAPFSNSASSSTAVANTSTTTQVVVLGYANAYGAPYLLFYLLSFAFVYLCTPLPGQVVLGLSAVAIVAYLEALDGVRDAKEIERVVGSALNPIVGGLSDPTAKSSSSSTGATPKKASPGKERKANEVVEPTTFLTILPLILLSFVTFYATGHQSTFPSVQWKTAFMLSEKVQYPWSHITVLLNSVGAFWVLGIVGGLLIGGWKRSPTVPSPSEGSEEEGDTPKLGLDITHSSILSTLLIQMYFLMLLFGASMSAAVFRRHLMVWEVFAPRFIAAVLELGVVDLGVLVGVWGVGDRVVERVRWILGRVGIGRGKKKEE